MADARSEDIGAAGARLVAAVRAGRTEAWAELIRTFEGLVLQVAISSGVREADREEVFQETWASLHRQISQLRRPASLAAWIVTTATRQARFVRSRRARDVVEDDEPNAATLDGPATADQVAALEEAGVVREEVFSMRDPCRELLLALFFESHAPSYDAVSRRLGRNRNSLGPRRKRCLEELGQRLERRGIR